MGVMDDAERFEPASVAEWTSWLAEHHTQPTGVWLVSPRSRAERPVDYEDAVVEALRFGWVDSTQKGMDEARSMLWFAPRRPGSVWTRPNKQRVAALAASGRLEAAGAAAVQAAKDSGMWTLMDSVEDRIVPDDLAAAFAAHPGAAEQWASFPPSAQKQILAWIILAKRPETRAARIQATAAKAARGERSQG